MVRTEHAVGSTINVLCARVRVEEKRLIEALATAGAPASALPPCSEPMPLGPSPLRPTTAEAVNGASSGLNVIIDRCQDRTVAAAILPLLASSGAVMIDAGVAATGDRLAVVRALTQAGIPRPETRLVTSEATGLAAFDILGVPSTLLPLNTGAATIVLRDREVAEAVFEHRNVLGRSHDAVALLQKGVAESGRLVVLVAGGSAIATSGGELGTDAVGLAEAAAEALDSRFIAIEIAAIDGELVVWDVVPVPEYRGMNSLGTGSIDRALSDYVLRERAGGALNVETLIGREALRGVAISA